MSKLPSIAPLFFKLFLFIFIILTVLVFEISVGKNHYLADFLCLIAAALITISLLFFLKRRRRLQRRTSLNQSWELSARAATCLTFIFLLLAWVFIAIADLWSSPGTFVKLRREANAPTGSQAKTAVALSGGGYRAALFHAGVLSELERLKISVQAISSVSGGSIIASFYTVGGEPENFLRAVCEHRFNLKREFLNIANVWRFSRSDVQANLLDRLFLDSIKHKETVSQARPELMICTTDVAAGELVGVTPHGIVTQQLAPAAARSSFVNPAKAGLGTSPPPNFRESEGAGLPGELRLSQLVAASGAFPGALNPLHVKKDYIISETRTDTRNYVLADGGVGDNLGLVLSYAADNLAEFAELSRNNKINNGMALSAKNWNLDKWNVDLIIASDGSAISPKSAPDSFLGEIGSSIDTMYNATGGDQMRGTQDPSLKTPPAILLSPRTIIDPIELKAETWQTAKYITYLPFGTELVMMRNNEQPTSITFTTINQETLNFIIEHMTDADRERAQLFVAELKQKNVIDQDGIWHNPDWKPDGAEKNLYNLVMSELDRRIRVFITTSTLDDQLDCESAESIYLLGQYMTRLNESYILSYAKMNQQLSN
jgi:predicted acylesterase/phospholipase RssA